MFVEAIAKGDPRTKNLWFDVTSVAVSLTPANAARIVERIRQLGVKRILFGSDESAPITCHVSHGRHFVSCP